ncbi:cytochrome P450 71A4-like [Solanum stenotomum]|uniref:cytochrome P450 71A4-like n=1 Tax=Solanum stenotomum TaxID=172797 RepID=UPI0020D00AD3|nr:cytochrome P450 71A4-like [Solanum stenotomum]
MAKNRNKKRNDLTSMDVSTDQTVTDVQAMDTSESATPAMVMGDGGRRGSLQCFFSPSNTQKRLLPPSPTKLPIIGNLHQLRSLPHRSLHKLSKKYGPLMLLHFGSKPVLVASSVDAARDIMKTHNLVWSNRPKSSIADGLLYGSKGVAFSNYSEYWRQIRSVMVLQLLSNKRVQSYRHVREEEISNMIDKIRQQCDSVIDLRDVLSCMTNNIISRVNIGRTYNEGESGIAVKALLEEILLLAGVFNIGDYIPWLKWLNKINGLDSRVKKVAKGLDAFLESENSINGGLDHTEMYESMKKRRKKIVLH